MNLTDYQLATLIGAGPFLILSCVWLLGLAVMFRIDRSPRKEAR